MNKFTRGVFYIALALLVLWLVPPYVFTLALASATFATLGWAISKGN